MGLCPDLHRAALLPELLPSHWGWLAGLGMSECSGEHRPCSPGTGKAAALQCQQESLLLPGPAVCCLRWACDADLMELVLSSSGEGGEK